MSPDHAELRRVSRACELRNGAYGRENGAASADFAMKSAGELSRRESAQTEAMRLSLAAIAGRVVSSARD